MANEETPITHVTLPAYATVLAGLGAGLPLPRALAHAEVAPHDWEPAAEHWQAQIGESAAGDLTLLVAFDGALLRARRPFEPTLEPIASDPRAWAQFRRHFVTAVEPVAFLAERGVTLSAYADLEAYWANRTLADEALAAEVQKHLQAPLEACPTLTVVPSPLLATAGAPAPSEPEPVDDARPSSTWLPVAISTPPVPSPAPSEAPRAAHPVPPPPVVPARGATLLTVEPSLDAVEGTIEGVRSPLRPPLPFQAGPAVPAPAPAPPAAPRRPRKDTGTRELPVMSFSAGAPVAPEGRLLNLEQFASLAAELSLDPAAAAKVRARWRLSEAEHLAEARAWAHNFDQDRALFEQFKQLCDKYRAAAASPSVRAPAPSADALPFTRAAPPAAAVEVAPKPPEVPRPQPSAPRIALGETMASPDLSAFGASALPFVADASGASAPPAAGVPEFTVQQYASLRVELSLHPDRVAYTLARYRVPLQARPLLDAQWAARMVADPALRDAYSRAYATYQASLTVAGEADAPRDPHAASPQPPNKPTR